MVISVPDFFFFDASSFKIIDFTKTLSQLKIKESVHIER